MVDRQFLFDSVEPAPRLAHIPDTGSLGRRLGLGHPRIGGNYRSTI
jgi:hypothetical protein